MSETKPGEPEGAPKPETLEKAFALLHPVWAKDRAVLTNRFNVWKAKAPGSKGEVVAVALALEEAAEVSENRAIERAQRISRQAVTITELRAALRASEAAVAEKETIIGDLSQRLHEASFRAKEAEAAVVEVTQDRDAALADAERFRFTSDKQTVAWKERALKAEAAVESAREERDGWKRIADESSSEAVRQRDKAVAARAEATKAERERAANLVHAQRCYPYHAADGCPCLSLDLAETAIRTGEPNPSSLTPPTSPPTRHADGCASWFLDREGGTPRPCDMGCATSPPTEGPIGEGTCDGFERPHYQMAGTCRGWRPVPSPEPPLACHRLAKVDGYVCATHLRPFMVGALTCEPSPEPPRRPGRGSKWAQSTEPPRVCRCGHSFETHTGHTIVLGSPDVRHCSQADGCRSYVPADPTPGPTDTEER